MAQAKLTRAAPDELDKRPAVVVATVRRKNQMTLPEALVKALGIGPGDRLLFAASGDTPGELRVRPLLRSYAGIFRGLFKDDADVAAYLKEERASWNE